MNSIETSFIETNICTRPVQCTVEDIKQSCKHVRAKLCTRKMVLIHPIAITWTTAHVGVLFEGPQKCAHPATTLHLWVGTLLWIKLW